MNLTEFYFENEQLIEDGYNMVLVPPVANNQGTAGLVSRIMVVIASTILFFFYCYQYTNGKCLLYVLYVQGVTAISYSIAILDSGTLLGATVVFGDLTVQTVVIGRYLGWIITCPPQLMGFFKTIGLLGPRISFTKINFLVTRDLVLIASGILASFQTYNAPKGVFLAIAVGLGCSLVYETVRLEYDRKDAYVGELWTWLVATTVLFFSSWFIFPAVYFLGPPVFGILGKEGEIVAHAVGDLLAKNCFGLAVWHLRYNIIYPYIEGEEARAAVVPYSMPGVPKKPTKSDDHEPDGPHITQKSSRQKKHVETIARCIFVEPRGSYQRLIGYMCKEVGIIPSFCFDLDQASQIIQRDHLDKYDSVVVNMSQYFEHRTAITKFRARFSKRPYFLPVLGYALDSDEDSLLLDQEETEQQLVHGVIHHMLDERLIAAAVCQWREVAASWRRKGAKIDDEVYLNASSSPNLAIRRVNSGEQDLRVITNFDAPPPQAPPQQQYQQQESFQQQPPIATTNVNKAHKGGRFSRSMSVAAMFDETDPRQKLYNPQNSPRNPSYPDNWDSEHGAPQQQQQQQQQQQPQSPMSQQSQASSSQFGAEVCSLPGCQNAPQLVCSGCRKASYCSREHQVQAWKSGHKQECR